MSKNLQNYNLQPADRVVLPKKGFPMIKHHAIYLGVNNLGQHLFAENDSTNGVQIVEHNYVFDDINEIYEIIRFKGNPNERQKAVNNAIALKGKKYDLINFNCEHFSEYVQNGVSKSNQVEKTVKGLVLSAGVFTFFAILSSLVNNKE